MTNSAQEMWRSKLGKNYSRDFMIKNETKLLKKLHQVRDETPQNRLCADCGTRGTVWASVNLGVFLCMTCGAHHRSLGTHISKPKGCTGTYWWGPDEIEQMRSIGNANAETVYGAARPPPGVTNEDDRAWKEFLMNKYVHKKFASQPGAGPTRPKQARDDAVFYPNGSFAFRELPKSPPKEETDLISFEDPQPVGLSSFVALGKTSAGSPTQPSSSGRVKQPTWSSQTGGTGDDFFAQFGL